VNLRHVVIPVLDLRRLAGLGTDDADGGGRVIVIVAREGQVFGLLADEIEGVARVTADALLETSVAGDDAALFSYTFERPEDGAVVALLNASAIAARPGIPVVKDVGLRPPVGGAADSSRRTVLLLQCGPVGLSIDVQHVHSVIPQLTLHSSPLDGSTCRGVVHLHGRAVPAVDPLDLLGLGGLPDNGTLRGLVLATNRGLIVLTVSDIRDITSVPLGDVLPLPPVGMRKDGFLDGILRTESGEQHLLLNGAALRADVELDTLAGLGLPLDGTGTTGEKNGAADAKPGEERAAVRGQTHDGRRIEPRVRKFLTYSVGMEAATPLEQITEILPYPEHAIALDSGGPLLGVFTHRRLSVPLLSLAAVLGVDDQVDTATARVLLIEAIVPQPPDGPGNVTESQLVGFVVPALHAIEDSVWEEASAEQADDPGTMLQRGRLVKIGTEEQGRLLPYVCLTALVAAELVAA
jgi:purine-binding chemotaxis protein CheW